MDFLSMLTDYFQDGYDTWTPLSSTASNPLAQIYAAIGALLVGMVLYSLAFLAWSLVTRGLKAGKSS